MVALRVSVLKQNFKPMEGIINMANTPIDADTSQAEVVPDVEKCPTGKLSFDTCFEAQKVINSASKRKRVYDGKKRVNRGQNKRPKRAYRCELCNKWHLTSKK